MKIDLNQINAKNNVLMKALYFVQVIYFLMAFVIIQMKFGLNRMKNIALKINLKHLIGSNIYFVQMKIFVKINTLILIMSIKK